MDSNDFDDIITQAKQIGKVLAGLYKDLSGEELDLETTIKHYPIVAVGLALGVGALAGVWVGSRRRPSLPPPPPPDPMRGLNRLGELLKREGLKRSGQKPPEPTSQRPVEPPAHPLNYLENLFPGGVDRVRDVLPDVVSEEAAALAKNWVDTVLEPRLRQSLDTMASNISEGRLGTFFKQTLERFEDSEDHRLDEPDDTPRNGPAA